MRAKETKENVPREMHDTVRQAIAALLRKSPPLTGREISQAVGVPEKEVAVHLEHLRKSLAAEGERLAITPPECRRCGFVLVKREKPTRPSRCPACRGESLSPPLFTVERHGKGVRSPERADRGAAEEPEGQ